MSSLGGDWSRGSRCLSRATVSIVSSTESVVWESQTTLAGSRTVTESAPSGPSTSLMCAGASPAVPTASSTVCTARSTPAQYPRGLASSTRFVTGQHYAGPRERPVQPGAALARTRGQPEDRRLDRKAGLGLGRRADRADQPPAG